ncbi:MAG: 1-deoxy-D-xylulose-5-phosphate synthase [Coriobacteriia bacterium]|nr:1-deoxy-D-xylulose-5-phosphate synthase [Coriobacteriia bacterium]
MTDNILDAISFPKDLKKLSMSELDKLALELRAEMIAITSKFGGHLAPSLGAIELILAAHYVLNTPKDKLIFDVGHQAYAHKIITGRRDQMYQLRQLKGISGFTKRKESPYDVHDSGHASDSLAVALGLAFARDLDGGDEDIVTIIGDAAMSGGLAFEALNEIGSEQKRMVIILNDNEMSISPSVGAFTKYLSLLRANPAYFKTRDLLEHRVQGNLGNLGNAIVRAGGQLKDAAKQLLVPGMFFEELGITYLGPIDGHSIPTLITTLRHALSMDVPVLIHAVTKKGKGYSPAEIDAEKFHGISPFNVSSGKSPAKQAPISYTKAFADQLLLEAENDENIIALTAAMKAGTGLKDFADTYPERFLDMGIAEEATVTTASGMAIGNKKPVVCIYSTFLQRAFDEIATNVCEPNLSVIFAIDRAGIVGEDGPTHHGLFDMSYLRCLPNMKIMSPSNEAQLKDALYTALRLDGPVAFRYPRGSATGMEIPEQRVFLEPGKSKLVREGSDVEILALGRMTNVALEAAELLEEQGISAAVRDMIWLKPLDYEALKEAASKQVPLVTLEEGAKFGGFSSAVLESLSDQGLCQPVLRIGIEDEYVSQGDMNMLLESVGLSAETVKQKICSFLDLHK